MSPYKACRFKPLGICLKKAFVQLKKTQLSSSVSDFDPEKDKFFKWFYNRAGLARSEQYGHGWIVFLCDVFYLNARRCLKEISSISAKNLMVTARLLGNSGDISNVTPSWCFRIPSLKFMTFPWISGMRRWLTSPTQPPSPRIVMASHFRVTESSPTVFQAQKALRRRLEELKKGGDALGMRQLPGNHREAKVSCIFLLQHELAHWYPLWFQSIPFWIGNEWRCRRTACIRGVRWGSWIGLFIPHALGKKNDIIQFTHSFIFRFRIDLDLLQVVNLSRCWQIRFYTWPLTCSLSIQHVYTWWVQPPHHQGWGSVARKACCQRPVCVKGGRKLNMGNAWRWGYQWGLI